MSHDKGMIGQMPLLVIVGAGAFGLAAAWELRVRGWDVTVVDPGPVPRPSAASTDVSKVVRLDYGADDFYTALAETALDGWDEWNRRWDPPLYHEDGFLLLAGSAMRRGGFEHDSAAALAKRGHTVDRLSDLPRAVRFPAWPEATYPDGYFNPRAGWAESGRVVARLAVEARSAGARLIEGASFAGLLETDDRVAGIRTAAGDELRADAVLMAAGAWTPAALPHLAGVMWTTGHPVVHIDAGASAKWRAPQFPVWAADIARTGWYGFPALPDGTLKIGHHGAGRRVHPDGDRVVLAAEVERFRAFLRDSLPELADAPIRATRLCLYCDTFDGDFWIDHDPGRPGLVVAAGDSGHGFKFAPVLGRLIADVVERKPNPWAHRFRWRHRDRDASEAARAASEEW
jgi:glycine/D-amino acid oxidase-like deaminating enzyme